MLSQVGAPAKVGGSNFTKALLGGFTGATLYGSFYHFNQYQKAQNKWNEVSEKLNKFEPYELKGLEVQNYPWYQRNLKKWEFQLVKLRGYFKDERFFVSRKRQGKDGYLVFAPFITALQELDCWKTNEANPANEYGVLVNIGWVPQENKSDIELGGEIVPPLELGEEDDLDSSGLYTGMQKYNEEGNPIEEEIFSVTEIVGMVRKGETQDILRGKRNWPSDGVYNFIDLRFMARFFRVFNLDQASQAYLERVVPSYEEGETLYPVPSSKDSFDRPVLEHESNYSQALFYAASAAVGFAGLFVGL